MVIMPWQSAWLPGWADAKDCTSKGGKPKCAAQLCRPCRPSRNPSRARCDSFGPGERDGARFASLALNPRSPERAHGSRNQALAAKVPRSAATCALHAWAGDPRLAGWDVKTMSGVLGAGIVD